MSGILRVDAVGVRVAIDLGGLDDEAVAAIRRAWADAVADDQHPADVTVIPRDDRLDRMMVGLSQQVTLAALTHAKGRAWMLHAAGVAGPEGDVIVLVGPSGRGKTTASRALGRHFGYVSDETIAIDDDGSVRTYRKPLSIIEDPGRPKNEVAPSEAGLLGLPAAPLRVRAIVLLDRDPEHTGEVELTEVDLGDALEHLVTQSSFLVHADAPLRFIAAVAEATGAVRRVRYREAADLPAVIGSLMSGPAVRIGPVANQEPVARLSEATASTPAEDAQTPPAAARYSRTGWLDHIELVDPERVAILTADESGVGMLRLIAGIAPALWRAAERSTLDELAAAAVARYGVPEGHDPRAAVRAAIDSLLEAGLLSSSESHP